MKRIFYDEWKNKRVNKIENIFGRDWFCGKSVLELGAAHGDIGIHFLKFGADVLFADARLEHLKSIQRKLFETSHNTKTLMLNQNEKYNLKQKFDLILHTGVLYHLENWKQDLECAMNHTNVMILESVVSMKKDKELKIYKSDMMREHMKEYAGISDERFSDFSQEDVENHLSDLGCKFFRFDTSDLNTDWSWDSDLLGVNLLTKHIYDWNYEQYEMGYYKINHSKKDNIHFRRMWLVLK